MLSTNNGFYLNQVMNAINKKEAGVSLIELAVVLPLILILISAVIQLGMYVSQTFWLEQTAYNASILSSELESNLSIKDKELLVSKLIDQLTLAHLNEGNKVFIKAVNHKVEPFNPVSADINQPNSYTTRISVGGSLTKLFNNTFALNKTVTANVLVTAAPSNDDPTFASSDPSQEYASVDCCGNYGSASTTSCVSSKTYSKCNKNSTGYIQ